MFFGKIMIVVAALFWTAHSLNSFPAVPDPSTNAESLVELKISDGETARGHFAGERLSPPGYRLSPPGYRCQQRLDEFCNNQTKCLASMARGHFRLPLVARDDGCAKAPTQRQWRCYSPSALSPDLSHYVSGPAYCTMAELATVLADCELNVTASLVFGRGMATPPGNVTLLRATEPSLLFIPPSATHPEGVLLAVAGGESATPDPSLGRALVLRRSLDGGRTWGNISFPFGAFADARTVGSFFQNQLTWDPLSSEAIITFGNITTHSNDCGNGGRLEDEDGLLQISSTDYGLTWSPALNITGDLSAPTHCLAPTTGHGVCMLNPNTPTQYRGRLVMATVHNAYHGDVIIFSDDGGKTYSSSGSSLHIPGLDEVSIAQLPNGSLGAIMRNCMPGTAHCQMLRGPEGIGGKRFLWSTSDDGGKTWLHPRPHPDLLTPVCQGSITTHGDTLFFVGPYSTTERHNLTVLGSADNGKTFNRSKLLWPSNAGYTGLQCDLEGGDDCAVLFDGAGGDCDGICFIKFRSTDVV